ncbi:MAG: 1-acyl-sn-glycerol-3-phosphate acyltransferase [Anaerolineales bacterium]|nr:1-acyl-sn-glycerol-3-phosphate acyltransferase [Anaerolineales bacterium]MBP6209762.1 1-acyl-sn-glycerol-3-phosphate acyltransferase [Anaerolineales bacterium]
MHWLINFLIRIYTRITCRIDAPDLHKFPMHGPLIAIANHTGQIEVPMLFAHLQPRKLSGWAKVEAWNNWFLRWVFNIWGAIPVHRGEADMKALKLALKALEEGKIFGLAPEGTRNKTGQLIRAMPGTVIIALHSGAPIIPIVHWGGEVYLKNLKRLKRTDFHIRVGDPFKLNVEGVKVTSEIRQQIVDEMMYEMAKLLPEEYRGVYSDMSKASQKYIQKVDPQSLHGK